MKRDRRYNAELAAQFADLYRERGYNPLPSRSDDKRPFIRYADKWEAIISKAEFDHWRATNIQVMTGTFWRLLVIDLDGAAAIAEWERVVRDSRVPTWISYSGGNGRHVWYGLPKDFPRTPKVTLWKGEGKHNAIECLCDQSLVVAPPSIHPVTGARYQFVSKRQSPLGLPKPAMLPHAARRYILGTIAAQRKEIEARLPATLPTARFGGSRIAERLPVLQLAKSWGLRITGNPDKNGWYPCRAIDREDRNPSASFHGTTGHYFDHGPNLSLSLFDLAAALGAYPSGREAFADLAKRVA